VHVDNRVEVVDGGLGQHAVARDPRVVDEQVQTTVRFDRGCDDPIREGLVGD